MVFSLQLPAMHIVIIGNGIAGITAARHIRKQSDHRITVISGESDYFFSRTALMYIYMGHMRFEDTKPYEDWFWEKNRIERLRAWVTRIAPKEQQLHFDDGRTLSYDRLIVATGSRPNKFGWPGQDAAGVSGLYHLQDLERMEQHSRGLKQAVIVGGGLIGIEMAEMFHARHIPVTFLVRENSFWHNVLPAEESDMVNRHIKENGIDLRLGTELKEILTDAQGKVRAVVTTANETITCGFVGLTAGVSPNIDFLKDSGIALDRGVLVNNHLETNIPGIFAVGDCAQLQQPQDGRRSIEAIWYTGRMMGEVVGHNVVNESNKIGYNPGIWFNSAKFFDIEYQVYGTVPAKATPELPSIYWEHPAGRSSIRIVYDKATGSVKGFNLMGIRYRHEVCEKWLSLGTSVEEVLQHLGIANFDPEFYPQYEQELVNFYNQQTGRHLKLRQRRGLAGVLTFLKN
ncbi:MAG: FAD/NAD(P)-binding oxidoreductase [Saprospiraceae bacterium]